MFNEEDYLILSVIYGSVCLVWNFEDETERSVVALFFTENYVLLLTLAIIALIVIAFMSGIYFHQLKDFISNRGKRSESQSDDSIETIPSDSHQQQQQPTIGVITVE